jgi:hypothetical protein
MTPYGVLMTTDRERLTSQPYPTSPPPRYPAPPYGWAPAYGPPPTAPVQPWKPRTRKDFWLRGPGLIILGVILAVLISVPIALTGGLSSTPAGSGFDVKVLSCEMTGEVIDSATVGLQVTNTQKVADSVSVKVEYRDGSGRRIDTDTAYIRDVQPGDTVKHEETTLLNASVTGRGACVITGIS